MEFNTTYIIPVRIDTQDRHDNLMLLLSYMQKLPNFNAIIIEADVSQKISLSQTTRIKYIYEYDNDHVFHRTKYINMMLRHVTTDIVAVWDTDMIIPYNQIKESETLLMSGNADVVIPYDGRVYETPSILKDTLFREEGIVYLQNNLAILKLMYGCSSLGGCFMVNTVKYIESGMENETFYGWAPEDLERVKRWDILDYKIHRICGVGFHLSHSTMYKKQSLKPELSRVNHAELFRICAMRKDELQEDIRSWKWCR